MKQDKPGKEIDLDTYLSKKEALIKEIAEYNDKKYELIKALTENKEEKAKLEKDFMTYLQEFDAIDKNKKTITNDEFFKQFNINVTHKGDKLYQGKKASSSNTNSGTNTTYKGPKELINNKIQLFFKILFEHGISPEDISEITEIEGSNSPYYLINIKKINKSIFINQSYGEATFIYNSSFFPRQEQLQKSEIKKNCKQINYNETREETVKEWEKRILKGLGID